MTFTPRETKYSGIDEETLKPEGGSGFTKPEAGPQYLMIEDAFVGEDDYGREITKVWFRSLYNDAKFFITKFMKNKDNETLNYYSMRWVNSLGYAICGIRTALDPEDLKGRVIMADVKLEPAWKDKKQYIVDMETKGESDIPVYANVEADSIEPVSEEVVKDFCAPGRQDQFFITE